MTGPLLAADLVTLIGRGWDIRAASAVLARHQIRRGEIDKSADERLRAWAADIVPVFRAETVDARCAEINRLLAAGVGAPYLTTHDSLRPHLHFVSDAHDVIARVRAVTAGGLALFVVESEGARLGVCQREGCQVAFVDTSRNGRRAYCSAKCGNYDAVRRHRAPFSRR
ncbi:CGNR zinc finger domain-containing protein [Microbacterium sp. M]|uniref:CGNR zinc finger domain-containing protein n=1 Tax=Microbacterium sp. M TaxID=3377125 RepID=UPI003867BA4D